MTDYGQLKAVTATPRATVLEVDALIGDTTLTVDYAGDFDSELGGTLDLNGARLDYTGITDGAQPDDPDVITLAAALTVGASANDAVSVVAGGQILTDYVAHVTMGELGDEVHVPLSLYQIGAWPLGDYLDPVRVAVSDDLLHLEDAPGWTATGTSIPPGITHAATLPRLCATCDITGFSGLGMTSGSSGLTDNFTWTVDTARSVGIGSAIVLVGGGAIPSRVNIAEPGIYAATFSILGEDMETCRSTFALRFSATARYLPNVSDVGLRGGDTNDFFYAQPVGSFTYYVGDGSGGQGDPHIEYNLSWVDFDTSLTKITLQIEIQKLS